MRGKVRCSSSDSAEDSWFHNSALRLSTITDLHCPSVGHFASESSLVTYPGDILPAWPADSSPKSSRRGRGVCLAGMKSSSFRRGSLALRCYWWSPSDTNSLLTFVFRPGILCVIFTEGHSRSSSASAYSTLLKWGLCVHLPNRGLKKKRKETINKEATHKWVFPKLLSKACMKVWNRYTAILEPYRVSNSKIGIFENPWEDEETAKYWHWLN